MILRHRRRATLALVLSLLSGSLIAACTSGGGGSPTAGPSAAASAAPSGAATADCPKSQPEALAAGETRTVTIETDKGTITMSLKADLSPIAVGNFVALASCGYYDGVVFHRLVPGFVIQGGDPTGTGTGGPGYTIADEPVTTAYHRGTIAMARTPQPNSVGSQFFIVVDDAAQPALASANTYQIIGEVSAGMDVVDTIVAMPNSGQSSGNQALDPVPMTKVTVSTP
jgi:cyclophilin family peptidyl-prolyl cis-trans isomerase